MASNKTKRSKEALAHYGRYQTMNSFAKNKARKLAKHLKNHPNDVQAKDATKSITFTRKKPTTKLGWLSESIKRDVMITIPYLNSKGNPIVVRNPDQLDSLYRTFGQAIPVTKNEAMRFAQVAKFLRKSPRCKSLVAVKDKKGNIDYQWKYAPFVKEVPAV